jgi:uncharacterized membrane protein (UPF0136 family)
VDVIATDTFGVSGVLFVLLLATAGLIAGRFFDYASNAMRAGQQQTIRYTLMWVTTTVVVFVLFWTIGEINKPGRLSEFEKWVGIAAGSVCLVAGYLAGRVKRKRSRT